MEELEKAYKYIVDSIHAVAIKYGPSPEISEIITLLEKARNTVMRCNRRLEGETNERKERS